MGGAAHTLAAALIGTIFSFDMSEVRLLPFLDEESVFVTDFNSFLSTLSENYLKHITASYTDVHQLIHIAS